MNYTIKSVLIIGAVAVASFFVASAVIPEKGAVAPVKTVKKSAAPDGMIPTAARADGDIPVVVADNTPAPNPIMASGPGAGVVPLDLKTAPQAPPPAAKAPPPAPVAVLPPPPAPPAANTPPPPAAEAMPPVAMAAPLPPARPALPPTVTLQPVMPSAPPGTKLAPVEIKPATFAAVAPAQAANPAAAPDTARRKKPEPGQLGYKLAKTAVCAGVENRAPVGVSDKFSKDAGAVYYFTYIVGAADTNSAVMHRWYREGKLIQTSILQIRSPNWRTHSKRNLTTVDEPTGNWRVDVVDRESGKVLESASFVVE